MARAKIQAQIKTKPSLKLSLGFNWLETFYYILEVRFEFQSYVQEIILDFKVVYPLECSCLMIWNKKIVLSI